MKFTPFYRHCLDCAGAVELTPTTLVSCLTPDASLQGHLTAVMAGTWSYPIEFDPDAKLSPCGNWSAGTPARPIRPALVAASLRARGWLTVFKSSYLYLWNPLTRECRGIRRQGVAWAEHENPVLLPWEDLTDQVRGSSLEHEFHALRYVCKCSPEGTCDTCAGRVRVAPALPIPGLSRDAGVRHG